MDGTTLFGSEVSSGTVPVARIAIPESEAMLPPGPMTTRPPPARNTPSALLVTAPFTVTVCLR